MVDVLNMYTSESQHVDNYRGPVRIMCSILYSISTHQLMNTKDPTFYYYSPIDEHKE
jgi:hypothetical protein